MMTFEHPSELAALSGRELGVSDWLEVPQDLIRRFAEVTGDWTWIHTDPERVRRELPGGTTIAHGYLTLSLVPSLMAQIYEVRRFGRIYNYGADRLRFIAVEHRADGGYKFTFANVVEIEHREKPAARFEMLVLMYPTAF
jgi:acyl dehydratase